MIHTKEPANVFYVYLTAYRALRPLEVNEAMTDGMLKTIRKFPGVFGNIESTALEGCFREAGQKDATVERTIKIRCTKESQVAELTYLACYSYEQDAVLVVNSQTHKASLANLNWKGEYPQEYPEYHEEHIGTFTKVDKASGEHYTLEGNTIWEVI